MLDVARSFVPKNTLLQAIDGMSLAKLNVLHLHLTDSQSWPIEIEQYPELAESASYPGKVYSRKDIQEIVSFAKVRGIKVIPEIDMPGHAPAGFSSEAVTSKHGNIVKCTSIDFSTPDFCGEPPSGQWNTTNPATKEVLTGVFEQLS